MFRHAMHMSADKVDRHVRIGTCMRRRAHIYTELQNCVQRCACTCVWISVRHDRGIIATSMPGIVLVFRGVQYSEARGIYKRADLIVCGIDRPEVIRSLPPTALLPSPTWKADLW